MSIKAAATLTPADHYPQPMIGVDHPTIKNFKQASKVLSRFHSQFQYPQLNEGYDNILYLKPSDHPSSHWSPGEVAAVLSSLEESTPRETSNGGGVLTVGRS